MQQELDALEMNHTWDLIKPPADVKPIASIWIYKITRGPNDNITKYKTRLVAKGYLKKFFHDYKDIFAPVAKAFIVRILLTIAAQQGWFVHHLDINNSFLHGNLDDELYLIPPKKCKAPSSYVCKLNKSLYGRRQAPRK